MSPPAKWKPMRSAPRDGTDFLACDAEQQMAVCFISMSGTLCYSAGERIVEDGEFEPTHWMPVPEPP